VSFNADAFAQAHAPWVFTADGEEFVARDPSVDEFIRFRGMMTEAGADVDKQRTALKWLLYVMFPPKLRYIWTGHPAIKFLTLPQAAQEAALTAFFARPTVSSNRLPSKAPGNGSGSRTATSSPPRVAPSPSK
jgi:hypothetical protein